MKAGAGLSTRPQQALSHFSSPIFKFKPVLLLLKLLYLFPLQTAFFLLPPHDDEVSAVPTHPWNLLYPLKGSISAWLFIFVAHIDFSILNNVFNIELKALPLRRYSRFRGGWVPVGAWNQCRLKMMT